MQSGTRGGDAIKGEEVAVGAAAVLLVAPMLQRAMERPVSWIRIDRRDGSDRGMMWQLPVAFIVGKLMKNVIALVCY